MSRKPDKTFPGKSIARREFLFGLGASIGSVALTQLLAEESQKTAQTPHLQPRAKRCIFLTMEGGPSHIDTFDPKPKLAQLHLQEFTRSGKMKSAMESGKRYYVQSPFEFHQVGQSGADMATNWEHLAGVADEICFYRGLQVDSVNHPTALYQMNTGNRFAGDPAIGSWVSYGLGSENANLPSYVVLPDVSYPQGGAANWGNGFLPAMYQGTALRAKGSPILNLDPPPGVTESMRRANLDLLQQINLRHAEERSGQDQLRARMNHYELAYRMQMTASDVFDLDQEPASAQRLYGLHQQPTHNFGRKLLLARRLLERGVRFVQVYCGTWDSHDYIARAHGALVKQVDQPIAGLLKDLKSRGMLEDTLVVWMGEFGRSPDNGVRGGVAYGRDHNPKAMTVWMAGGGVIAGSTIGVTDETGAEAMDVVHHVRDFHVTLLRLMGLDDNRLTYFHSGRFKQLSQFGGQPIQPLIQS